MKGIDQSKGTPVAAKKTDAEKAKAFLINTNVSFVSIVFPFYEIKASIRNIYFQSLMYKHS